jgi:hypothetical protein
MTEKVKIFDVRDVADVVLDRSSVTYLMLFSDDCYRNPQCYNIHLIMRSDRVGYGLIIDYDQRPGHIESWRIRGCAFWRDYELVVQLIETRPDLLVVSEVAKDRYLRDAAVEYADDSGIAVETTPKKIPGDVMAIFRAGREADVVAYLRYAIQRLLSHLGTL